MKQAANSGQLDSEMSSVLTSLRTFCKRATSITRKNGNQSDMYTVTGVLPVARQEMAKLHESEHHTEPQKRHSVPLKAIRVGNLYKHFESISKNYGSLTPVQIMGKKCVVLNSLDSVTSVFSHKSTDGRLSPFFQPYVLKTGFSFSDLSEAGEKQKQILKQFMCYNLRHGNDIIEETVSDAVSTLVAGPEEFNPDVFTRRFLSDIFNKLVCALHLVLRKTYFYNL